MFSKPLIGLSLSLAISVGAGTAHTAEGVNWGTPGNAVPCGSFPKER